ncbi:hypothetical protein [Robertmurraya kyonggiensis]|uniref:hypothetical protein n=1 Tax=Robertmurraya kyonggiensis TaxID=1037680 RepID=UPI00130EBF42|nr:hypothetical protein [Robertmurraya kyonggiensis]
MQNKARYCTNLGQKNNSMGEGMERKILLAWNKKDNDVNWTCCVKVHRGNLREKNGHW